MHELSLWGQIPQQRHDQLLNILSGVAAMLPFSVEEHHYIFKPKRPVPPRVAQIGASQAVLDVQKAARQPQGGTDLYYLKLVQTPAQSPSEAATWEMVFYDVPEPGNREVISRLTSKIQISDGNALAFMDALGYRLVSDYILKGDRFIYNNVVFLLHRLYAISPSQEDEPVLLDPSGGYMLQAFINIEDGGNPDLVARGTGQLIRCKEMFRGCVELKVVGRLSMDTRTK